MAGFSYAEAAKGHTPAPSAISLSKQDQSADQTSNGTASMSPPENRSSTSSPALAELERNDSEETLKVDEAAESVSKTSTSKSHSATVVSGTESPSLTESAATLLKDDDVHGNADDSESTTWDKVSESSHPQEKATTKSTGGSDDSKTSESWEHVPVPRPVLKEAPPPTINPWTKRAQDAQAKAKATTPSAAIANHPAQAGIHDATQQRKKSRASVPDQTVPKAGDRPAKIDDGVTRRYKPSSETRLATRLPPPASDSMSWPTPESAKVDEKDKEKPKSVSQDRSDASDLDKDKAAGAKRGRKQWEHVEFVPTAVFNTPLPTSRRGGRPSGRGGRDAAASRGGPNGAGNDRSSEGEARTPSTEAPVESSRSEAGQGRPNQAPFRTKRMSNAAQTKPRDLKKSEVESSRLDDATMHVEEDSVADLSKGVSSAASGFDADTTNPPGAGFEHGSQGLGEVVEQAPLSEGRAQRHFREDRRDSAGQGREYSREGNGMPRESRSERGGRGGHRGRGNFNGFPQNSHASGNSYASNLPFAKSHGYHERSSQYQGYGTGREGKHYRSGSRSQQSAPVPQPRYGAYPGMPPYAASAVPPELANGYMFPPAQAPQFYHPSMDQAPLVGIIAEQMRYYFSIDNLVRDMYLRSRMDDQGFIPLEFMMPWRRMKMMTSDINLVRFACQQIPLIELRLDVNGVDYIRPASDWAQWVLKHEERLEEARNDGPTLQPSVPISHQYPPQHMYQAQFAPAFPPQGFQHRHGSGRVTNGSPPQLDQIGIQQLNGSINESQNQTPLSATVPEFQPTSSLQSQQAFTSNGIESLGESKISTPTTAAQDTIDHKPLSNGSYESTASPRSTAKSGHSLGPILATPSDLE